MARVRKFGGRTRLIGRSGGGGGITTPVYFDGATVLQTGTAIPGIANSRVGTCSIWFRPEKFNVTQPLLNSAGNRLIIDFAGANRFNVDLWGFNGAGVHLSLFRSPSATSITSVGWHHGLAAWDLNVGTTQIVLDGVLGHETLFGPLTTEPVYYIDSNWVIGGNTPGSLHFLGHMAHVWWTDEYHDISLTNIQRMFLRADGRPAFLGGTGAAPSVSNPKAAAQQYLTGANPEDFQNTRGHGTAFTALTGGLLPMQLGTPYPRIGD